MKILLQHKPIKGKLVVPASKSHSQRALVAAALSGSRTTLYNYGNSGDEQSALNIFRQTNLHIENQDQSILIDKHSFLEFPDKEINVGESGLLCRMMAMVLTSFQDNYTIQGTGSLENRNMQALEHAAKGLGRSVTCTEGKLPLYITGSPYFPEVIRISGATGSQHISGLMMALAFRNKQVKQLIIESPTSIPYLYLTESVINEFGHIITIDQSEEFKIHIDPNKKTAADIPIQIEADWSNAAFWILLSVFNNDIILKGLDPASLQADKAIINLLSEIGIEFQFSENQDFQVISTPASIPGFILNLNNNPDLFPVMAIFALKCNSASRFLNISRLKNKESDRLKAVTDLLDKTGILYDLFHEELIIYPAVPDVYLEADASNDHRMVMALVLFSLIFKKEVSISGHESINKSYPGFYRDLELMGIQYKL